MAMDNSTGTVPTFPGQGKLPFIPIKSSTPLGQLFDQGSSLAHHEIDHLLLTKPTTSKERVFDMGSDAVGRVADRGYSPLGLEAV